MPRFDSDVIGKFELRPEVSVIDYLASKASEKNFVLPPNWDSPGNSVELLVVDTARTYDVLLCLQKAMLANNEHQDANNVQRVNDLYKMQKKLRERFIKVNQFIKECDDKRRIASKIVDDQTILHQHLHVEIERCKKAIGTLTAFRKVFQKSLKKFLPYERISEEVVNESDIYTSIKDCIERCDALMLAQVEINREKSAKLDDIEEMRQRMIKVTNDAALVVLGLKNNLIRLERSYNQAQAAALNWEKVLADAKDKAITNEKEKVIDAVAVLFQVLRKRECGDTRVLPRDVERNLNYIKREMELLHQVIEELEETKTQDANLKSSKVHAHC